MNITNDSRILTIPFINLFISLIPIGKENAIKRQDLVDKCIQLNLIEDTSGADRAMRHLLNKARESTVILNLSNGKGYFIPTPEDADVLKAYIAQEDSRAKSSFRNHTLARKLYEDYRRAGA